MTHDVQYMEKYQPSLVITKNYTRLPPTKKKRSSHTYFCCALKVPVFCDHTVLISELYARDETGLCRDFSR